MKNKKNIIIASAASVAIIAGVIGIGYGQINKAENNYTQAHSVMINIEENIIIDKNELIDIEAKIQSLDTDKKNPTELKLIIEEIEKGNFKDRSKINENVVLSDRFNNELDKIMNIYKSNDNMKNNVELTNKMSELEGLNNLIDGVMENYNTMYSKDFNESIKKFPVKLAVKKMGWYTLDKFDSIN